MMMAGSSQDVSTTGKWSDAFSISPQNDFAPELAWPIT